MSAEIDMSMQSYFQRRKPRHMGCDGASNKTDRARALCTQ
jgi:hypothetical protein